MQKFQTHNSFDPGWVLKWLRELLVAYIIECNYFFGINHFHSVDRKLSSQFLKPARVYLFLSKKGRGGVLPQQPSKTTTAGHMFCKKFVGKGQFQHDFCRIIKGLRTAGGSSACCVWYNTSAFEFKAVPGINSSLPLVLPFGCRCVVHIRLCRGSASG